MSCLEKGNKVLIEDKEEKRVKRRRKKSEEKKESHVLLKMESHVLRIALKCWLKIEKKRE